MLLATTITKSNALPKLRLCYLLDGTNCVVVVVDVDDDVISGDDVAVGPTADNIRISLYLFSSAS